MSSGTYWDLKGILSEIRSNYNCMDEEEEPYYRALSEAIRIVAQPEIEERKEESAQNVSKEDLISRKAAIDALIRKIRPHNNGDGTITMCVMSEELVRKTLNDLPSAQPEIIRCKDCRYTDEYGVCQSSKGLAIQDDDDFCSHAERREG